MSVLVGARLRNEEIGIVFAVYQNHFSSIRIDKAWQNTGLEQRIIRDRTCYQIVKVLGKMKMVLDFLHRKSSKYMYQAMNNSWREL